MSSKEAIGHSTDDTQERNLVPKLRFTEFRTDGEWRSRALSQLCEVNPPNKGLPSEFLYIDLGAIEGGRLKEATAMRSDAAPSRAQRLLKGGDVLFQTVRPNQKSNYLFTLDGLTYVASTGFAQLRPNASQAFLYQAVQTDTFIAKVLERCSGSNYPAINSTDLSQIMVATPEPGEQQKVGDCLSSVDELIAAEAEKLEALKAHKKGLMQLLFPAEGESNPRLRFPQFCSSGEWKELSLSDLGDLIQGLTYSPSDVRDYGLLVLRSSNIKNNKIVLDDRVYVDPLVKGVNLSEPDDILICVRNGSTTLIGKNALLPAGIPLCTHGAFMSVFRSAWARFVFQLFQTPKYQKQVAADLGATINSINGTQFLKYRFRVPDESERRKLTELLSSADELIAALGEKVEFLKKQKMGLMQQLFPSITLDEER
jgi:type I restriction enzyme S subunit